MCHSILLYALVARVKATTQSEPSDSAFDSRGLYYVHYHADDATRNTERVVHRGKPTATVVYSVRGRHDDDAGGRGGAKSEFEDEYESYLRK